MILADTSVWIEFLRGNREIFPALKSELETGNVVALECIFAELLQGAVDHRERRILLQYWESLPRVDQAGLWIEAGEFAGRRRLGDGGVGLIDAVILLAARKARAKLWTLDRNLSRLIRAGDRFSP